MKVEKALQRFIDGYEREATAKTYRVSIQRWLNWHRPVPQEVQDLDFSNVIEFAKDMRDIEKLSKRTIGGYIAAVKQFCRFLTKKRIAKVDAQVFLDLQEDIKEWNTQNRVRKLPQLPKDHTVQATMQIAHTTDSDHPRLHLLHLRNKALIETFRATACRVSEAQALKRVNLNSDMTAWVRGGKGDKDRMIVFDSEAWDAVQTYLKARDEMQFTVIGEEVVFGRHDNHAHFLEETRDISTNAMRNALEGLSKKAKTEKLKPHGLRHWRATHFLEENDITMVQKLLGHEDISTTQVYLHLSNEDLKQAVQGGTNG